MGWLGPNPNGLRAYLGWANDPSFIQAIIFLIQPSKYGLKWTGLMNSAQLYIRTDEDKNIFYIYW